MILIFVFFELRVCILFKRYGAGEGASSDIVGVRAAGRAPPPRGDAVLVGPHLSEAPVRQPLLEHQPGRADGRRALVDSRAGEETEMAPVPFVEPSKRSTGGDMAW